MRLKITKDLKDCLFTQRSAAALIRFFTPQIWHLFKELYKRYYNFSILD